MTTITDRAPGKCIFCGGGRLCREHVWPQWADDLLPKSTEHGQSSMTFHLDSAPEVGRQYSRQGSVTGVKLRVVCRTCNSGWMSQLEEGARQEVTALITGARLQMTTDRLDRLTAWVVLKLMVSDASPFGTPIFEQAEREAFYQNRTIPENLTVQVYRCGHFTWQNGYFATDSVATNPPAIPPVGMKNNLKNFVLCLGEAMVHAVYARHVSCVAGQNHGLSCAVLPRLDGEWTWPPQQRLSEEQAAALAFGLAEGRVPGMGWASLPKPDLNPNSDDDPLRNASHNYAWRKTIRSAPKDAGLISTTGSGALRQPGTSHVTFSHPGLPPLTVPAHKPIKPIYIIRFLALLDALEEGHDS